MLGSPGGGTIINTVLQVLLNVVVYNMDVLRGGQRAALSRPVGPDQMTLKGGDFLPIPLKS